MRSSGVIAGSLALTLVAGGLLFMGVAGAALLWWAAPNRDSTAVREALIDHQEDLSFCAAGTRGGELTVTVSLNHGEPTHVGVTNATVPNAVANCIAEGLVSRNWPEVTASGTIPVRLEP